MLFQDKLLSLESIKVIKLFKMAKLQGVFTKYEILGFHIVTVISGILFKIQLDVFYIFQLLGILRIYTNWMV